MDAHGRGRVSSTEHRPDLVNARFSGRARRRIGAIAGEGDSRNKGGFRPARGRIRKSRVRRPRS